MKAQKLLVVSVGLGLFCTVTGAAQQEKGGWRAAGSTARAITGDVVFSSEKISINFSSFPLAQIRDLKPGEISAALNGEATAGGSGNLYRLSIPASKVFLHHNTLCGSEETQWVATYAIGHTLQLLFFSGPQMPVFTADAIANTTDLCGRFSYVR